MHVRMRATSRARKPLHAFVQLRVNCRPSIVPTPASCQGDHLGTVSDGCREETQDSLRLRVQVLCEYYHNYSPTGVEFSELSSRE